jgi:hypothetical protein
MLPCSHPSRAGAAAAVLVVIVGCSRSRDPSPTERPAVSSASEHPQRGTTEDDDTVRSIYPLDVSAPDPLALRLCNALQELPPVRRAACCATAPGALATSECVRMLSAALHSGAVTLVSIDVDRCVEAMDRATEGCDWIGPNVAQPPVDCQGIVHGSLTDGSRCRSSLECVEGIRCQGLGPTTAGRCGAPRDEGAACGGSVDPLAVYVRQNDYESHHPECSGWCNRRKCAVRSAIGQPCVLSSQCTSGASCAAGMCTPGEPPALPPRKPPGEPCVSDRDCIAGCIKLDGGARGRCGKRCE